MWEKDKPINLKKSLSNIIKLLIIIQREKLSDNYILRYTCYYILLLQLLLLLLHTTYIIALYTIYLLLTSTTEGKRFFLKKGKKRNKNYKNAKLDTQFFIYHNPGTLH